MKTIYYKYLFITVCCCVIVACTASKVILQKPQIITVSFTKKHPLTKEEKQNWQHKDILEDSIPGVSLDKAYRELLTNKKRDTVIIAVIDTRLDVNHEEIRDYIWTNEDEIPNNRLDDDNNGYIDDIHGWNFLGNEKGEQAYRANFEYVRIIRKFKERFEGKKREEIGSEFINDYDLYLKAKKAYNDELKYVRKKLSSLHYKKVKKNFLERELAKIYPEQKVSVETLQNIETADKKVSQYVKDLIKLKKDSLRNANNFALEKRYLNIYLNEGYKEREIIGDDVDDINDVPYGNNKITSDNSEGTHIHAIKVAGIIAASRNNETGIKGIINRVKIMPIAISPYGDEKNQKP